MWLREIEGNALKLNKTYRLKKAADALKILAFHAKHKQLSRLTRYSFISPFLVCLKMRLIYIFLSSVRVLCSNKLYNSRPVIRLFFTIADSVSSRLPYYSYPLWMLKLRNLSMRLSFSKRFRNWKCL